MKLFNKTVLPNAIIAWSATHLSSFDLFRSDSLVTALDYYVSPVGGDTSYLIFQQDQNRFVFITTDHPDPFYHRKELERLSGKYSFEKLIAPASATMDLSKFEDHDLPDDFFVKEEAIYYYCAQVEVYPSGSVGV